MTKITDDWQSLMTVDYWWLKITDAWRLLKTEDYWWMKVIDDCRLLMTEDYKNRKLLISEDYRWLKITDDRKLLMIEDSWWLKITDDWRLPKTEDYCWLKATVNWISLLTIIVDLRVANVLSFIPLHGFIYMSILLKYRNRPLEALPSASISTSVWYSFRKILLLSALVPLHSTNTCFTLLKLSLQNWQGAAGIPTPSSRWI